MKHKFIGPLLLTAFVFAASITNAFAHSPWITLQGGHYLIKRPNDGDSFHVSVEGHEYIFRLYFVDAPETSAEFRDRVEEQAKYFGVTVDQVLEVGDLAKTIYAREADGALSSADVFGRRRRAQPNATLLCLCPNANR